MSAKILQLKAKTTPTTPTLGELVDRVHKLSKDSSNMMLPHPHLKERMIRRGRTMREILETLRKGEGIMKPTLDDYGDYRIKMRRVVAGKRIQVVVAVRETDFSVVTVI